MNNIAQLHLAHRRFSEAEPVYQRSLEIRKKALGPDHPEVAASLNNLGWLQLEQGRYADAEAFHRRALTIREKAHGPDHVDVGQSLNNLAWAMLAQRDFAGAAQAWRGATSVLRRRAERGVGKRAAGSFQSEAAQHRHYFEGLVKAARRLATEGGGDAGPVAAEMFEIAQWGNGSKAAAPLAQMAARSAGGSPKLAALVRERQDLVAEWQAKDERLIAASARPPAKRNAAAEAELRRRLTAIDKRLADIDTRLAEDFADYAALASPKPISVSDVQASSERMKR